MYPSKINYPDVPELVTTRHDAAGHVLGNRCTRRIPMHLSQLGVPNEHLGARETLEQTRKTRAHARDLQTRNPVEEAV